jgi:ectoine hydroxylase-related dioxygenase (phytanoyl-CoA dioxygenase family)
MKNQINITKSLRKHLILKAKNDWYKLNKEEEKFFLEKGCKIKKIMCPKGSLVLWDSRTIHCGVEALKGWGVKMASNNIFMLPTKKNYQMMFK